MVTRYFIQDGLIVKKSNTQEDVYGLFSLDKFFKKLLTRYHVPFDDDCCTPDLTNLPVRYNQSTAHVQYYNPTTKLWTNVPAL